MGDIFISYSNHDRERVRRLADLFQNQGYSVWWDRELIAGKFLDRVLERGLEATRCVLVLWSDHSVACDVVKAQAGEGAARGVLVQACLEKVQPPPEFRQPHDVDLTDWAGDEDHPGLGKLLTALQGHIATAGEKDQLLASALIQHETGVVPSGSAGAPSGLPREEPAPSRGLLGGLMRRFGRSTKDS